MYERCESNSLIRSSAARLASAKDALRLLEEGTRKEDILLASDELAITQKLRRVLASRDPQQGLDLLLQRLRETRGNVEFVRQITVTAL